MSKNRKRNKKGRILFATDNPNPEQSNYVKKVANLHDSGVLDKFVQSGGVFHTNVYHDDWCNIYKGGNCNCDPDIEVITDEEYKRRKQAGKN